MKTVQDGDMRPAKKVRGRRSWWQLLTATTDETDERRWTIDSNLTEATVYMSLTIDGDSSTVTAAQRQLKLKVAQAVGVALSAITLTVGPAATAAYASRSGESTRSPEGRPVAPAPEEPVGADWSGQLVGGVPSEPPADAPPTKPDRPFLHLSFKIALARERAAADVAATLQSNVASTTLASAFLSSSSCMATVWSVDAPPVVETRNPEKMRKRWEAEWWNASPFVALNKLEAPTVKVTNMKDKNDQLHTIVKVLMSIAATHLKSDEALQSLKSQRLLETPRVSLCLTNER